MLTEATRTKLDVVHESNQHALIHGDVVETLRSIPSESIEMIFADPPYRLSNGGMTVQSGRQVSVNKADWDVSEGPQSDFEFHLAWLKECQRVLTKDGTLWVSGTYHSIYQCGYALQLSGFRILNDIAWFKPNAAPNLGGRNFAASHETLIWAAKSVKSRHTFNYGEMRNYTEVSDIFKRPEKQMRSVWGIPEGTDLWVLPTTPRREKEFPGHPTQKPLALLDRIIRASTQVGDTILDPFVGSGTTGVAAVAAGRKFIGIDNNREYLTEIALPRIIKG